MRLPAWEKSPMYCIGLPWPYSLMGLGQPAPCPPVQMEMCTGCLLLSPPWLQPGARGGQSSHCSSCLFGFDSAGLSNGGTEELD